MDIPVILIKIVGIVLFIWTVRSIYVHFKEKREAQKNGKVDQQSLSEKILNDILLYLWLAFMLVFSSGMFFNNQIFHY